MSRTTILVADSLAIFRTGVRNLLQRESDLRVVEAETFEEVSRVVECGCPDIALIDLDLPPLGGVEAVRLLNERCTTHLIVWSFDPTRESVLAAVRAGADGYLHKHISPAGLVRSLRGVIHGEAPLSRDLATLMIDALHGAEERDRTRERLAMLSSREREILSYVSEGARNRQIASALTISEFTVKRHMQNILGKLGVQSRRAAGDFYLTAAGELAGAGTQIPA
jgi:DNA-binding NarL/FixJ family response regulator